MLYTVVPLELVYPSDEPRVEEETRGSARLVWRTDGGTRTLMRVISTDLGDYLRYKV